MTKGSWHEDQLHPSYHLPVPSHWGTRGNTELTWVTVWVCTPICLGFVSGLFLLPGLTAKYSSWFIRLKLFGFSLLISWEASLLHSSYWLAVRSVSALQAVRTLCLACCCFSCKTSILWFLWPRSPFISTSSVSPAPSSCKLFRDGSWIFSFLPDWS